MRHEPCENCDCTGIIESRDPEIDDYECEECRGLGYLVIDEQEEQAWNDQSAGDFQADCIRDNSL